MASGADVACIERTLDFALRRHDHALSVDELTTALLSARVDVHNVEMQEVVRVLDPVHQQKIVVPALISGYRNFWKRHKKLLGKLSSHLSTRRMSPDELFA